MSVEAITVPTAERKLHLTHPRHSRSGHSCMTAKRGQRGVPLCPPGYRADPVSSAIAQTLTVKFLFTQPVIPEYFAQI